MTRIDMTTRQWHELIKPVLPHILADKDYPELNQIRIEAEGASVIAVATDRYTIGAERHPLAERLYGTPPIALDADDAKATLKLFAYSKDEDPPLRITIDRASVPIAIAGTPAAVDCMALTLEDDRGTRIMLRDATTPGRAPLANWRKALRDALRRPLLPAPPTLSVHAVQLGRWAAAVRKGERLAIYAGQKETAPLLVLVEDHFAGLWVTTQYLDGPDKMLAESRWHLELYEPGDDEIRHTPTCRDPACDGDCDFAPDNDNQEGRTIDAQ